MFKVIGEYQFVVGALSGSLAAYLLGLIVSYLRREKRWLGISITSRMIVERGHQDLTLVYKGRNIERLHSHGATIRNIGNKPLTKQLIRVEMLAPGEMVGYELNQPPGANFQTSTPSPRSLVVDCDLLNPGEAFRIGVTVVDSIEPITVTARGENLICKDIGDGISSDELLRLLLAATPFFGQFVGLWEVAGRVKTGKDISRR